MKRSVVAALVACAAALSTPLASAADAASTAVTPTPTAPVPAPPPATAPLSSALPLEEVDPPASRVAEPVIKRTVIEDRSARIDELRVRGQLQKITVSPKGGVPGYEVLLGDGAHVVGDDPGTSRGSAGKRVWNVLRF
jgi:hypothetical protein